MIPGAQLVDEPVREDLGTATSERHLRPYDRNSHCCLCARRLELGLQAIDLVLEVVDQAKRGGVERPLVVRERLHVPAHQLAQHRLDRRPDAAANAGSEAKRSIRRDGPEPLGFRPGRAPIVLVAGARARVGAGTAYLFAQRAEELLDVDRGICRRNPCRIAIFGVVRGHRMILPLS